MNRRNRYSNELDTDNESEAPSLTGDEGDLDRKFAATTSFDDEEKEEEEDSEKGLQFLPSTYRKNGGSSSPKETTSTDDDYENDYEGGGVEESKEEEIPDAPPSTLKPAPNATETAVIDPFSTPRETAMSVRTWWMVDLSLATAGGDAALDTLPNQGATPLVKRCMRNYAWDELHARRVLASYRQFLLLKIDQKDWRATKLSPCPHVELMWKEHICDMANYYQDCLLLCQGNMVHYNPDEGEDAAAQAKRAQKTRTSLQRKFGTLYDSDLWNMGLSKEATKNVLKSAKGKGSSSMSMRAPSTMRAGARSGTSGSSNSKPSKTL